MHKPLIISSKTELEAYVKGVHDDLDPITAEEFVDRMDSAEDRPTYGRDWSAWLERVEDIRQQTLDWSR